VSYGLDPADNTVKILEENHYYPFGFKHFGYNEHMSAGGYNYRYNGKEQVANGFYDYGARQYDPALGRWFAVDPLAEVSRRWSPYTYCYNNPMVFVDPDGMKAEAIPPDAPDITYKNETHDIYASIANEVGYEGDNDDWVKKEDGSIKWEDKVTSADDKDLKEGDRYLGKAVVVFEGSKGEKLGSDGTLLGKGAESAKVTIYGPKGKSDIKTYDGLSVSSDPKTYSMIEEGEYEGRHQQMGTSPYGKGSLTYRIHNLDGTTKINPEGGKNKINGKNYMEGIFFHRTNWSGKATASSQGCLNIDGRQWKDVEKQLGKLPSFRIILNRD